MSRSLAISVKVIWRNAAVWTSHDMHNTPEFGPHATHSDEPTEGHDVMDLVYLQSNGRQALYNHDHWSFYCRWPTWTSLPYGYKIKESFYLVLWPCSVIKVISHSEGQGQHLVGRIKLYFTVLGQGDLMMTPIECQGQ